MSVEPTWKEIREAIDRHAALGDWITQALSRKQAVQGLRSGGRDDAAAGSASGSTVCDPPPEAA